MKRVNIIALVFAIVFCFTFALYAQATSIPEITNYRGVVKVDGSRYEGTGYFKFAVTDKNNTVTYWTNDGTTSGEPLRAVAITVTNGVFTVPLGDASLTNMQALATNAFATSETYLHTYFSVDNKTFQELTPATQFLSVPYAYSAETVGGKTWTEIEAEIKKNSGSSSFKLSDHNVTELKDVSSAGSGQIITAAERAKLNGIASGATETNSTNVAAAGALMDSDFTSTGLMAKTGTNTYGVIPNNSINWDNAVTWGNHATAGYASDSTVLKKDGSVALTANWDIGDGRILIADEVRARDAAGLKLFDDAGIGLFVKDGGNIGVGTTDPANSLEIEKYSSSLGIVRTNAAGGSFLNFRTKGTNGWIFGMRATSEDLHLGYDTILAISLLSSNGYVGVGTQAPTSTLHVNGSLATKVSTAENQDPYPLSANENIVLCQADISKLNIRLPKASNSPGRQYTFKATDVTKLVEISRSDTDTIDGSTSIALKNKDDFVTVVSNGTGWSIINQNAKTDLYDIIVSNATELQTACNNTNNAGKTIFLHNGTYTLTTSLALQNGMKLIGESREGVLINCDNKNYQIKSNGDPEPSYPGLDDTGTISVSSSSSTVTGSGSQIWSSMLPTGKVYYIIIRGVPYKVKSIDSATQLTLEKSYQGVDLSGEKYAVGPFDSGLALKNLTITASASSNVLSLMCTINSTIENIAILDNSTSSSYGLDMTYCWHNKIVNCSSSGNMTGISVTLCSGNEFFNISCNNNINTGFSLNFTNYNLISNLITNNNGIGVYLQSGSNNNQISNFEVNNNDSYGLSLNTGISNKFSNGSLKDNGGVSGADIYNATGSDFNSWSNISISKDTTINGDGSVMTNITSAGIINIYGDRNSITSSFIAKGINMLSGADYNSIIGVTTEGGSSIKIEAQIGATGARIVGCASSGYTFQTDTKRVANITYP